MDLIFKRYADPYTLLDSMIENHDFEEFVCTLVKKDDDEKLWDMFIHKCWENISFKEFKAKLYGHGDKSNESQEMGREMSRDELEATIRDSMSIIENFEPM